MILHPYLHLQRPQRSLVVPEGKEEVFGRPCLDYILVSSTNYWWIARHAWKPSISIHSLFAATRDASLPYKCPIASWGIWHLQIAVSLWMPDPAARDAAILKKSFTGNFINLEAVTEIIG
ncbi:hypothetical protein L1987_65018 [Smallanthus sonchifolius]|uniref:Uncharacterized protein n=1 Tax=Smallanthus sonchifolius TaxID=185202 RepID=A0ACB9BT60_9ASTR|nr:hypothetical protein L1987_65018 [Smallanthus sonchifolius]